MHSEASAEHAAGYVQLASPQLWGEPQLPAVFLQAKSCPVPWGWCNGVFLGKGLDVASVGYCLISLGCGESPPSPRSLGEDKGWAGLRFLSLSFSVSCAHLGSGGGERATVVPGVWRRGLAQQ